MDKKQSIHVLKLCFFNFVNYSYIIFDQAHRQAVIIDPVWEFDKITDKMTELDAELTSVLLTHSHFDHTNLAERVAEKYNANIYMLHKEIEYYKFNCKRLNSLYDGDILKFGDTAIECIHTPGHTVGSASFLINDSMFTGDFIFIEGCGVCTYKGASARDMFISIQKIKSRIPLNTHIFPGHSYGKSPGYPLKYLLENNIYFQINNMDKFIEFRQRKNQKGIFDFK